MKRAISLFLVFSILFVSAFTYNIPVFAAENKGSITLSLDSNRIKEVGEIITATVEIKDVPNFAGCQFNIKYDPTVLQPVKSNGVPYTNSTPAEGGTILNNSNYGFLTIGHHDLQKGELNFSKSYLSFNSYKASGKAEESGILAVIRFKVLKNEATSIKFADTKFMPGANSGVYLFNWDGNQIKDFTVNQPEDLLGPSSVFISLDSDKITQVGQIIKATVNVDNMDNLAGYQFNIKYDPEVLQPVRSNGVPYESGTIADKGELLSNPEFGEFSIGDNDLKSGIINQGKAYLNLNEYKNSGNPESTGSIAIIYFKVLKVKDTTISFAPHRAMPEAIEGTMLFDWNGDKISNYSVLKEAKLTAEEIVELPEIKSVTADKSSPQYEDTSITWTCDATGKDLQYAWTIKKDGNVVENKDFSANNTFTYIAETAGTYIVTVTVRDAYNNMVSKESEAFVIIEKEIEIPGHVSLSVDKNKITKVGEIITATVNVKDMQNLAGFQVNIKYDPTILQPVKADGSPYKRSTFPEDGTLINNNEYLPIRAAGNDVDAGIVNFGKSYAYMNDYRENGVGESTGSLGVIYFKVLAVKPTTLSFEDTATMPGAIDGTMMFDWNANKKNNYTVEKSVSIDAEEEIIELPEIKNVTADKSSPQYEGTSITWTCDATGKDLQYAWTVKRDGNVVESKDFSANNTFTYTAETAGTYLVTVTVKDAYNNQVSKDAPTFVIKEEVVEIIGSVGLSADKTKISEVGEIITVTINAKDMQNLAGFQVNIKYDPTVLQPVKADGSPYKKTTFPEDGTLINNRTYSPITAASNNLEEGTLNFGKLYVMINDYKETGVGESTGSLATIRFKVLDVKPTTVAFAYTNAMPDAETGTMMFDWDANRKHNYIVDNPSVSFDAEEEIIELPEIKTVTADKSSPQLLGTSITWTCDATGKNLQYAWTVKKDSQDIERTGFSSSNTFSFTPEEAGTYVVTVTVKDKYNHQVSKEAASFVIQANENPVKDKGEISIVLDKNTVSQVGEIVKATIHVKDLEGFSAYQINLKYDPNVLQPVDANGNPYSNRTAMEPGTLLANPDYGPYTICAHETNKGILNFSGMYLFMNDYKADNVPESSGTLGSIRFKVLKLEDTTISFEDHSAMPGAISGTILFNWDGNEFENYQVIKEARISAN